MTFVAKLKWALAASFCAWSLVELGAELGARCEAEFEVEIEANVRAETGLERVTRILLHFRSADHFHYDGMLKAPYDARFRDR